MYCPHCGASNADGADACGGCGAFFLPESPAWQAAQRGYADLTSRYARGEIDSSAFQNAHLTLAVKDHAGRSWLPGDDPARPYLWDGTNWSPQAVARIPAAAPTQPTAPVQAAPPAGPARPPMGSDSARGAPREAATPPAPRKRHRLRGCCLGTLAALLLLAAAAVWISPLPEQWGIRQPASVKVFGEQLEPDRSAELELRAELEQAGLDTTGLYAYVLPYNDGRQGAALYAVLDSSQGFRFPTSSDQNAMLAYMVQLANSPALATAGVDRIALDYRDASGESVLITTAPAESIRKFARGEIGREAFFQELEARTDPGSLTEGVLP